MDAVDAPRLGPWRSVRGGLLVFATITCYAQPASAQFIQEGSKLVGAGYSGTPGQGGSVALSSDGSTAIVGGPGDNCVTGAAWVFSRNGRAWSQQGSKLVGPVAGKGCNSREGQSVALSADGNTAIVGAPYGFVLGNPTAQGGVFAFTRSNGVWVQQGPMLAGVGGVAAHDGQGWSVALSADGNTAIVGEPYYNFNFETGFVGGAWIFTRTNGVWTQQGPMFAVTDYSVTPGDLGDELGFSVALSGDGNTAIVGGPGDAVGDGAAWVFTRSGGVWIQQGPKLVGTGPSVIGNGYAQGSAVALSNDGSTAIVGAPQNLGGPGSPGAAWVFTRSGGAWTQQGSILVGTGAAGPADQGGSVALSGDGNTAIVGGYFDNDGVGAAWVFTRSGGAWTQQGTKLAGLGAAGPAQQGWSVALSADASTVILGGNSDHLSIGAAWVLGPPRFNARATHDFDGNGKSDILWRDASGNTAIWLMSGGTVSSSTFVGNAPNSWSVVGQRDFDGNGKDDILWRDSGGNVAIWLMNGATVSASVAVGNVGTSWSVAGTGDFNGDGKGDILWHDSSGNVAVWLMNGGAIAATTFLGTISTTWSIAASSGQSVLWRNTSGDVALWLMSGGAVAQSIGLGNISTAWSIVGAGDFDGDGNADILWRDSGGNVAMWLLDGSGQLTSSIFVGNVPAAWSIAATGDFDGDGKSDILWHDGSGNTAIWLMNGGAISASLFIANVPTTWAIQGAGAD